MHMLCLTFVDFYVFRSVVPFIAVDMVDDFSRFERSAEDFFGDYSVFRASVELAVVLAVAFVHSRLSMLFSVAVLILPPGRVEFCV